MKNIYSLFLIILLLFSCASPLTKKENKDLSQWKQSGFYVEEKKPSLGIGLGFLPGGGSFYGREYTYGVVNLLLWPASVLWDPISGYNAVKEINYTATKENVDYLKNKEERELEDMLQLGVIDRDNYIMKRRKINEKYNSN